MATITNGVHTKQNGHGPGHPSERIEAMALNHPHPINHVNYVPSDTMPPMVWYRELIAMGFLLTFCSSYYIIPILLLIGPMGSLLGYTSCIYLTIVLIVLAVVPMRTWRGFRCGYVMRCVCEYFAFRWIDDEENLRFNEETRYLAVWFPHGIVPVGNFCGAAWIEENIPHLYGQFGVSAALLRLPFLRQVFGIFDIASADSNTMKKTLKKMNMSLMPGGLAELFLCDKDVEQIYIKERKGFCKLALQTGADLDLFYIFGNTQLFDFMKPSIDSFFSRLCRRLGVMLPMLFWGRYYLPLPYRTPLTLIRSAAVSVKHTEYPTQQDIDELHQRVIRAIQQLYQRHRDKAGKEYKNKELIIR